MKQKTCKICKCKFTPTRELQPTCSNMDCMIEYSNKHLSKVKQLKIKNNRKILNKFNNSDVSVLKRKAQTVFNAYIRKRDEKLNCISCGHNFNGITPRQRHAGHYRPQGGHSLLRYDERNVHAQCSICNNYKSGNLAEYRINLIKKIGIKEVEKLESMNTLKKWTVEELKDIICVYKDKLKRLDS